MEYHHLKHIKDLHILTTRNAIWIALIGGIILTAIMSLSHLNAGWVMDADFHPVMALSTNVLFLFSLLIYVFTIVQHNRPVWQKYIFAIGGALLIVFLFSLLTFFLHRWIYEEHLLSDKFNINLLKDSAVAMVAIALALFLYNLNLRQQMNIENEKLQNENLIMRLEALEGQLDPHFLFNSLNTLSGLIEPDNQRAQQYLQQLATTYRYIIRNQRIVSLADELKFVDSYCKMMQTRYGDNLHIERHIDPACNNLNIIPLSIQLLIENALKHNVVSDRYPLTIRIETLSPLPNEPVVRVSNVVRLKQEEEQGNGVGLVNLSKRYMLQYNKDITISNVDNVFSVDVPLVATKSEMA